ncbi:MAG TPA: PhoH family protein, partial [Saprospiraceae bacterium]|nr:PhoH family protein [Saprospiraceae bacterium]
MEGHPFSLLPLDPWQATAMQQVERSRITVAAGISGTGKTNLIANVIINALANGRKCLMVCSRLSELKEAQAVLGRCG